MTFSRREFMMAGAAANVSIVMPQAALAEAAQEHLRHVRIQTDVLVAGGGLAGVCAALAAARRLVEDGDCDACLCGAAEHLAHPLALLHLVRNGLLADGEATLPTPHPKLRIARPSAAPAPDWFAELEPWLAQAWREEAEVKAGLRRWVPEYRPAGH